MAGGALTFGRGGALTCGRGDIDMWQGGSLTCGRGGGGH